MINYPVFLTYSSLIIFIPCLVAPQQSQTPLQYDSTKIKIKCKVNIGFINNNCKQISGRYTIFCSFARHIPEDVGRGKMFDRVGTLSSRTKRDNTLSTSN